KALQSGSDTSKLNTAIDYWGRVEGNITQMAAPYFDCEQLIKIFQPMYEQSKDADLRDRILKLLDRAENCNTNEFYMQLAEESFKANPTAAAGATLANAFYGQKNYAKSLEY